MARYHMYWQVYYHPVARSVEAVLVGLFKRLVDLYKQDTKALIKYPLLIPFIEKRISNTQFLALDEFVFIGLLQQMKDDDDAVLRDLARRLLDRDLFGYEAINGSPYPLQAKLQAQGFDPKYYYYIDLAQQTPYYPYILAKDTNIWIVDENQVLTELSQASHIVEAIVKGEEKQDKKVFYPKEVV